MAVMMPEARPRLTGEPLPESLPSSWAASVNPMEMPAPTEADRPTRKVCQVSPVAKAAAQSGAMPVLLLGHIVEDLGRLRIGLAQALCIGAIDPPIVLLRGYGESEDFLLAQGIEGAAVEPEDAGEH